MSTKRRYWGWGNTDFVFPAAVLDKYKMMLRNLLQVDQLEATEPLPVADLQLRAPRFTLPASLEPICSATNYDRAGHSYGKSFRDVWRGLHGHFPHPPDYVAFPHSEEDVLQLMQFARQEQIALIPYGGGSSVCGGVEATDDPTYRGTISVDLQHFDQLLDLDHTSRSAHLQGGMYGPAIEAALKPHGVTLRHYPQSFEFSTLGGWIATRSGGHFATLYTHIDEFVQSVRMVTPEGIIQTRRLPGHGAGPAEERLYTGSEGTLGIITSAWMRLQTIPQYKRTVAVNFPNFKAGAAAARALAQSGLYPANARLIDAMEAFTNGLGDGQSAVLLVGFESHQHPVEPRLQEALTICREHGGSWEAPGNDEQASASRSDTWKQSFLLAPYLRDELLKLGMIVETFETATTWDQYPAFYKAVRSAAQAALQEQCGFGLVTCRFTHIYPDGPAPYFTVIAPGKTGRQLEQWDAIKAAVSQAIIDHGGTITHHHAVGRDHLPYYQQQRTPLFGRMLASAKKAVDPDWILNPGVLLSREENTP